MPLVAAMEWYGHKRGDALGGYIENMHEAQPFMPPFPGNARELELMGAYLEHLPAQRCAPPSPALHPSPRPPQRPSRGRPARDEPQRSRSPRHPGPHDIPLPMPAPEPVLVAVLIIFFLMHIAFVNVMVGGALLSFIYEVRGLKQKRYDRLAYEIASTIRPVPSACSASPFSCRWRCAE